MNPWGVLQADWHLCLSTQGEDSCALLEAVCQAAKGLKVAWPHFSTLLSTARLHLPLFIAWQWAFKEVQFAEAVS